VCGGLTQRETGEALAGRSARLPGWLFSKSQLGGNRMDSNDAEDGKERREMAELVNILVVCG